MLTVLQATNVQVRAMSEFGQSISQAGVAPRFPMSAAVTRKACNHDGILNRLWITLLGKIDQDSQYFIGMSGSSIPQRQCQIIAIPTTKRL